MTLKTMPCHTACTQQIRLRTLACSLHLWPEVLDGVQVREVHPLLVGGGAVVPILLHVQAVQAHVHAIHTLEQQDHLQARTHTHTYIRSLVPAGSACLLLKVPSSLCKHIHLSIIRSYLLPSLARLLSLRASQLLEAHTFITATPGVVCLQV